MPAPRTPSTCATQHATPAGSDEIKATYSGDATDATSTSSPYTETTTKASTTTSVSSSDEGSGVVGAPVTYTATVAPVAPGTGTLTGTVSFYDNSASITECTSRPLDEDSPDTATCTTDHASSPGSDKITATYSGDSNYATSTSLRTARSPKQCPPQ